MPKTMDIITLARWKELLSLAKAGSSDAQWEVGYYHEFGAHDNSGKILVRVDRSAAHHWYELAAKQDNHTAQCALSNLLSSGERASRNYKTAIYWAKKAINHGNASAAFNLGTIYRDLKKPTMAFRWYSQAVSMGDNDALLQLGLCSLFGFGTKRDIAKAYDYLNEIITREPSSFCQRTIENVQYWLAILHLLGIGKSKGSVANARTLLESANGDDDHEQANEILNILGKSEYLSA